ncbi:MAG: transcriptional repressor [Firmicutes bacterium]|nr:transcriptional repressor [Bacillota bacterium]
MVLVWTEKELDIFINHLNNKGQKLTSQRKIILNAFLNSEHHVSTEELYDTLKQDYPAIGLATVYRTLKLLCECGLAIELRLSDGIVRYEHLFNHDHHDHLVCMRCGKIIEVVEPEIEELQEKLARDHGFSVIYHQMELYGICRECDNNSDSVDQR